MSFSANPRRYDRMRYRRCGRSGLALPEISLGLWQNFGGADIFETGRAILGRAFDLGITHFDLANNYGPPYGSAEENFGAMLRRDFASHRDELIISSKAGWDMWPGPYGVGGSRKYLVASLDQSLKRMGLDYVDIFYSHRVDRETPLEETAGALAHLHRQGKALYVGISCYSPALTAKMYALLSAEKIPLVVHQPSYSMLNRWIEDELLAELQALGVGCVAFSPLAQGMLTSKYLDGIPADARASRDASLSPGLLSAANLKRIAGLDAIARERGQSLAQMAVAWVLRDRRVTSALIGARTVRQLEELVAGLDQPTFDEEALRAIDVHACDGGVDLWRVSSAIEAGETI